MPHFKKSEWAILSGLMLLSFVPCVGGLVRFFELMIGAQVMPPNPRVQAAPLPVIIHLIGSIPFCVLGILQFLPSMRSAYPRFHRVSGRLIVMAGALSAISGLWMTHFYSFTVELQGPLLYWVRFAVGVGMIASLCLGLSAILNKRVIAHKAWMLRAYALGQGAGTQVFTGIGWMLLFGEPLGLTRDLLMTLSWAINLAVVEMILRRAHQ
ncbi:MAG: DUF2306 domain-containing protein [Opitutaceae bacterium]